MLLGYSNLVALHVLAICISCRHPTDRLMACAFSAYEQAGVASRLGAAAGWGRRRVEGGDGRRAAAGSGKPGCNGSRTTQEEAEYDNAASRPSFEIVTRYMRVMVRCGICGGHVSSGPEMINTAAAKGE